MSGKVYLIKLSLKRKKYLMKPLTASRIKPGIFEVGTWDLLSIHFIKLNISHITIPSQQYSLYVFKDTENLPKVFVEM